MRDAQRQLEMERNLPISLSLHFYACVAVDGSTIDNASLLLLSRRRCCSIAVAIGSGVLLLLSLSLSLSRRRCCCDECGTVVTVGERSNLTEHGLTTNFSGQGRVPTLAEMS